VKYTPNAFTGICRHCKQGRNDHQWICASCGTACEDSACPDCDKIHLPKPKCDCKGVYGFYCPEAHRRLDRQGLDLVLQTIAVYERLTGKPTTAFQWEVTEAKRCFAKTAS
jgi:hypothetical protein